MSGRKMGQLQVIPARRGKRSLSHGALTVSWRPASLNIFMNIPWRPDGALAFEPALSKPGDAVTFRAELDCVCVMSACPQDILAINSKAPVEAHFEILD
jgi:hypothetical protein